MARMAKGLMGTILVTGEENASLMHTGPADSSMQAAAVPGITAAAMAMPSPAATMSSGNASAEPGYAGPAAMDMNMKMDVSKRARRQVEPGATTSAARPKTLDGCLSLQPDGKAMLTEFTSHKLLRVEGRPLLFDANNNHLIHLTGYWGSVVETEDPRIPSFVVNSVLSLAQSCNARLTKADIQRIEARAEAADQPTGLTIGMADMAFLRSTIVITAGQEVVWKNTSATTHNVVANPALAVVAADAGVPAGAQVFASQYLNPGATFKHRFTVPGVYKYVCTLHEANGMKGVVIVKPSAAAVTVASAATH
jgi:plastocyanin